MNGRGFDYNMGRFLSVDPVVEMLWNTQARNGYSYVENSPLSNIDPSGYSSVQETQLASDDLFVDRKKEDKKRNERPQPKCKGDRCVSHDRRSVSLVSYRMSTTLSNRTPDSSTDNDSSNGASQDTSTSGGVDGVSLKMTPNFDTTGRDGDTSGETEGESESSGVGKWELRDTSMDAKDTALAAARIAANVLATREEGKLMISTGPEAMWGAKRTASYEWVELSSYEYKDYLDNVEAGFGSSYEVNKYGEIGTFRQTYRYTTSQQVAPVGIRTGYAWEPGAPKTLQTLPR